MAVLILLGLLGVSPDTSLMVMTFNIRYDNPGDGERSWQYRAEEVAAIMSAADIIGIQEALHHQMQNLARVLPAFGWIGVGRDDGHEGGEYAAIFYRRDRFRVVRSGRFWLSQFPLEIGSVGWDAALPRIATWAAFEDKISEDTTMIINTHFDHRGEEARLQSARLIVERADNLSPTGCVVVMGDFNALPGSEVLETLTAGRLADARSVPLSAPSGPEETYTGFRGMLLRRLDYILVSTELEVLSFETIPSMTASDHLSVVARLRCLRSEL